MVSENDLGNKGHCCSLKTFEIEMTIVAVYMPELITNFHFQASFKKVVLAEKTPLSSQYFYDLQKFIVIERGLVLLPVASPTEAGKILAQMVDNVLFYSW